MLFKYLFTFTALIAIGLASALFLQTDKYRREMRRTQIIHFSMGMGRAYEVIYLHDGNIDSILVDMGKVNDSLNYQLWLNDNE